MTDESDKIDKRIGCEENLGSDFARIILNSENKRQSLINLANTNAKYKNIISLLSGTCSLLSAVFLAHILVKSIDGHTREIVAIILAFAGGLLSIANSFLFKVAEIIFINDGASKFHSIREIAATTATDTTLNFIERTNKYKFLQQNYIETSKIYDQFAKSSKAPDSLILNKSLDLARNQIGEDIYDAHMQKIHDNFKETIDKL